MKTSDSIDQLAVALAAAQGEISPAPKDKINPHFKSHFADLAGVWEACRESLSKHGLSVVQSPAFAEGRMILTTRLMHKSGQWMEGQLSLKPRGDDPQSVGSAITYARRYALGAVIGVVSDEDDDGNAASKQPQPQQQQRQQPQQQQWSQQQQQNSPLIAPPTPLTKDDFDKIMAVADSIEGLGSQNFLQFYRDTEKKELSQAMTSDIPRIKEMINKIKKDLSNGT